jgi:subtilisin family serine protease
VLRDETLTSAGVRVQKLRLPRNRSVRQAQAEILALGGAAADRNAFYRPQQDTDCTNGDRCGTRQLIDWPATLRGSCLADVRIGVVDTRINLAHPALAGQNIETLDLKPPGYRQSGSDHGTAVISILVGNPQGPAPGLLPQASVVHADPYFRSSKGGDLAEIVDVVRAVDAVLERKVSVINMSMSGPANTVVEKVLERASASGIAIVAAVGNAGPRARPLYPAAYDVTVSVTAIGEGLSIYRRAGQGQHVDFAAPGVALDVAGGRRGTVRKTGTSFAAPFVTASLAAMKAGDATRSVQELVNELAQSARDLGKPGKDPVFGWGLVQAQGVCRTLS